eukprot:1157619-Pelagomonas_calceolata.AAC.27
MSYTQIIAHVSLHTEWHEAEAQHPGQIQGLRHSPKGKAPEGQRRRNHGPAVIRGVQAQLPHAGARAQRGAPGSA